MRILVRAHKSPFRAVSAEDTIRGDLMGGNAGNLVFSQAVFRLLWRRDNDVAQLSSLDPRRVNDEADVVVLPLANAFRRSFLGKLDALTDFIEQLTVPVVVLGVGAQSRLDLPDHRDEEVDAAAQRFVRATLNTSPSIGVRGEFTRDYLNSLGFADDNIAVIGCPSMFMFGPDLPPIREVPELTVDHRIAFNASPYRKKVGALSMRAASAHPRLTYFAQDQQTLELLLHGEYPGKVTRHAPVSLEHPLIRDGRVLMCLDPPTWMRELSGFDYSFGTRIHGNITALLSGTPATVISHDSRTLELAEYHRIPHVPLSKITAKTLAPDLHAQSDWSPMRRLHPRLWEDFAAFLAAHRLRHTFEDGESPEAFDRLLGNVEFPPPVRTVRSTPLDELYAFKRAATSQSRWATLKSRAVRLTSGKR